MDVGGTPGWYGRPSEYANQYGENSIKIFTQNSLNNFQVSDDLLNYGNDNPPFTFSFADVFGDSRDEIITADYGGGDPSTNPELNQIRIFSFDDDTGKYELYWKSNNSSDLYNAAAGLGATSIKVVDFDNDGIKDISVAREGEALNGDGVSGWEIWIGNGDGTFYPNFSTYNTRNQLEFREFYIMDVNLDGFEDIILRRFHYGSYYRNNPVWWNVAENNGIKFNHLIWINQGNGTFHYYNEKELKVEGINIDNVHPYMKMENYILLGHILITGMRKN